MRRTLVLPLTAALLALTGCTSTSTGPAAASTPTPTTFEGPQDATCIDAFVQEFRANLKNPSASSTALPDLCRFIPIPIAAGLASQARAIAGVTPSP